MAPVILAGFLSGKKQILIMNNKSLCTIADVADLVPQLRQVRQHLHQHPELSNEESATAALVAEKLESLGYQVTTAVGGYGVVGSMKYGNGSRSIGIRADMDALPITERTDLSYSSQFPGKMHACGHDGHTTMLLGAAEQLARSKNFSGTVHLIFQPAEEIGFNSGAERMLAEQLFERFPCDAVYGLHNHPGYPVGKMMFRSGPFMAACDTVNITIHGKGGHAARPHMTVDPILVASSLVIALQSLEHELRGRIGRVEPAAVGAAGADGRRAEGHVSEWASVPICVQV